MARAQSRVSQMFSQHADAMRRHTNPWSVYTRFAAIPAMILTIWSRVWLGWWALAAVLLVVVWLLINPFVFRPVDSSSSWASKGIYGEKLWLTERDTIPATHRAVLRWLIAVGIVGFIFLAWGLWSLSAWATVYGATLVILAQLWRIDRMGLLFDEFQARREE